MKRSITMFLASIAMGLASTLWAGPAEEVSQIGAPRQQAFQQGNVETYTAAFADNAVFQSSLTPFRIEGKEAIRAFFTQLFQTYPKRGFLIRQPATRVYGDNLVVQNGYSILNVTNEKGEPKTYDVRYNVIWSKIDGRWQIVDQHVSRLPVAQ